MQIQDIVICLKARSAVGGVVQGEGSAGLVVDEIHHRRRTAAADGLADDLAVLRDVVVRDGAAAANGRLYDLLGADAAAVIGVADAVLQICGRTDFEVRQLSAVLPAEVSVFGRAAICVGRGIAGGVIGDGAAVDLGQQVVPTRSAVGVGLGGAAVFGYGQEVPGGVVGVGVDGGALRTCAAVGIDRLRGELVEDEEIALPELFLWRISAACVLNLLLPFVI